MTTAWAYSSTQRRQLSDTQEQIYGWKVVVWGDSQMAAHRQNDVTSGMFQTQQHICVADTAKFNRFACVKHHSCCNCNKTAGIGHAVCVRVCLTALRKKNVLAYVGRHAGRTRVQTQSELQTSRFILIQHRVLWGWQDWVFWLDHQLEQDRCVSLRTGP